MPSSRKYESNKLLNEINICKESILNIKADTKVTNKIVYKNKTPAYGLIDLIAGKTPTYTAWDNNPTDGANITDGDINTFCNTGNKTTGGGWQWAYIEFDLGAFYNILTTGYGAVTTNAGSSYLYIALYNGVSYHNMIQHATGSAIKPMLSIGGITSKIRLGFTTNVAAIYSPNIREFHVWRLI